MKKIFFLAAFAAGFIVASAQNKLINDPNAEARKLNSSFHAIEVSNAIDLYLSQGDEEAVAVSASDKSDIYHIITEVDNGVLKIRFQNTGRIIWHWKDRKFKAYVSFKNIDRLSASGASNVYVEGTLTSSSLAVHMSGASDLKGNLKSDDLKIDLSGASDALISGSANNVIIDVSGASDVKAFDFVSENCTAHASGASDIKITVNKELNVHASGASDIHYKGTATIKDLHSSGASSVSKRD
jgi:putative autotransporter adhesin-like protein